MKSLVGAAVAAILAGTAMLGIAYAQAAASEQCQFIREATEVES